MNQNQNPIIVGLDIGTTKIAVVAGQKNNRGKIEILGYGLSKSQGISHGEVLNIDQCHRCINQALTDFQRKYPKISIKEVYVGVAGHHIKSLQTRGERVIQNEHEIISKQDVELLRKEQLMANIPASDQIIDVIPQEFTVTTHGNKIHGTYKREEVIGMSAKKLASSFHIVTAEKAAIKNINKAVQRSNLSIKDFELQPLASAAAVLSPELIELGVAIIDIGGGTTDLAVFHEGILKHTAVIPRAGENITKDIKRGLGVLHAQAEGMKVQFGAALADKVKNNTFISIPTLGHRQSKEISAKNLANIIQSRMEEILEYVQHHLKQLDLEDKLHGGVILTGGGSQLQHLKQLTEFRLGMNARIGFPNQYIAGKAAQELNKPMFATCIGLILRGYDDFENDYTSQSANTIEGEMPEPRPLIDSEEDVFEVPQQAEPQPTESNSVTAELATLFQDQKPAPIEEPIVEQKNQAVFPRAIAEEDGGMAIASGQIEKETVDPRTLINSTANEIGQSMKKIFARTKGVFMSIFDDSEDEKLS